MLQQERHDRSMTPGNTANQNFYLFQSIWIWNGILCCPLLVGRLANLNSNSYLTTLPAQSSEVWLPLRENSHLEKGRAADSAEWISPEATCREYCKIGNTRKQGYISHVFAHVVDIFVTFPTPPNGGGLQPPPQQLAGVLHMLELKIAVLPAEWHISGQTVRIQLIRLWQILDLVHKFTKSILE